MVPVAAQEIDGIATSLMPPRWRWAPADVDLVYEGTDDEPRSTATHMTQGAGAVLGLPLMSTGEHRFVFVIRHSRGNDGFGMRLGIADADPSATEAAPSAEHYWGFCPYDGRLHAARGGGRRRQVGAEAQGPR